MEVLEKQALKYGFPKEEMGFRKGDVIHCRKDPVTGELEPFQFPMPAHRAINNPSLREEVRKHLHGDELKLFNGICEYWDAEGQFGLPASRNYGG